jgi:hypothetical protein
LQQAEAYSKGFSDILANHGLTIEDITNKSAEELADLGFTENEIASLREYTQGMQEVTLALKDNQGAIQDQLLETY